MKNQIFVTGATGNIGSRTIKELMTHLKRREDPHRIYAGVPSFEMKQQSKQQAIKELTEMGATIVELDAAKPETLENAFKNVQKVLVIPSTGEEKVEHALNYIEAASKAKVQFVVLISVIGAEKRHDLYGRQFMELEAALARSTLKNCILRVGFFQQDLLLVKDKLKEGKLALPIGEGMFAPIHWDDVARSAALVLDKGAELYDGKTLHLVGPELLNGSQLAEKATKDLKNSIKYAPGEFTLDSFKQHILSLGLSETEAEAIKEQCALVAKGGLEFEGPGVKEVERQEAKSVDAFFMENKKVFTGREE
ncbi:hypothetical protein BKA69DRAFT_559790 [Paraphysoderma sedebokerense]|nr:hypothetical protein BKA69DRAFT_559790 [Paraphysoderma sedebokerense]